MIVRARAPLRLGFAGGGTDVSPYCDQFGGQVMNAAIDKYAYATIASNPFDSIVFDAIDTGAREEYAFTETIEAGGELRLLKGVYARIIRDYPQVACKAISVRTFSDAPPGSGLGASSTMVVALIQAFSEFFSLPLGEYELAHLAYEVERIELRLAGGKQDHYAAAFGGFNFMEFYAGDRVIVNPLRIKDRVTAELECSLVLCFTGVSRSSARIIEEQSENVLLGCKEPIQAMHDVKREAVVMKESLLRGDLHAFGRTLQATWEAKKRMAVSIASADINHLEQLAMGHGAYAAKVSGAGGGGFMMFMCSPENRIGLARVLEENGSRVMQFHFCAQGATSWRVR